MIGGVGLTGILVQQGARGGLVGGTCPRVAGGGSGAGCVLVLSRPGTGSAPAGSRAVSTGLGEPENSSTTGTLSAGWHTGGSAYQE